MYLLLCKFVIINLNKLSSLEDRNWFIEEGEGVDKKIFICIQGYENIIQIVMVIDSAMPTVFTFFYFKTSKRVNGNQILEKQK